MPDNNSVIEITAPIEIEIVDDRLQFTFISGNQRHTYSVSHYKARNAAHVAVNLLNERQDRANVREFRKRGV